MDRYRSKKIYFNSDFIFKISNNLLFKIYCKNNMKSCDHNFFFLIKNNGQFLKLKMTKPLG